MADRPCNGRVASRGVQPPVATRHGVGGPGSGRADPAGHRLALLFFIAPLYVVLAILFGGVDPILRQPVPVWNPLDWDFSQFNYVMGRIFGHDAYFRPALIRTVVYVGIASFLCLLIAYPVAYFTARFSGRCKGLLLAALIAPFWISYMMRMLAWINLLQTDGLLNRTLELRAVCSTSTTPGCRGTASPSSWAWSTATCPT